MDKQLVFRSIKADSKGHHKTVKLIDKDSMYVLQEGILDAVVLFDLDDDRYLSISPKVFMESFEPIEEKVEKKKDTLSDLSEELKIKLDLITKISKNILGDEADVRVVSSEEIKNMNKDIDNLINKTEK